jgi:UDP-glucuronate 4-epimerase
VRILLTGGAGFIGSHLGEAFLARGAEVFCLDNFDPFYPRAYKEANLHPSLASDRYHLVEGDIRDETLLRRLFTEARPDAVVHLAARAGVRPSVADPEGYVSVNLTGTARLLEACRRAGVGKLLFGSSSSVYGEDTPVPFREDAPANRPASPYAATKKAGEELIHAFHRVAGLDAVCVRYFTVYGPRQRPEMAVHKFARYLTDGRPVPVYGGGLLERDFTYVSDAVEGTVAALDFLVSGGRCFEVVNLADARTVTLHELLELLQRELGAEARVRFEERPPGDVERTLGDISKARRLLGFEPRVDLEEGLRRFVAWFAAEGSALRAALTQGAAPAAPLHASGP